MNTDLLTFRDEQRAITDRLTHALSADDKTLAAWLSTAYDIAGTLYIPCTNFSIVVSDQTFDSLTSSLELRKDAISRLGEVLLFSFSEISDFVAYALETSIVAFYTGEIAPHLTMFTWWPESRARVPDKDIRLLFDKVQLTRSSEIVDPEIFGSHLLTSSNNPKDIARHCCALWYYLYLDMEGVIEGRDFADGQCCHIFRTIERRAEISVLVNSRTTARLSRKHTFLTDARSFIAASQAMMDILRRRGIDVPSSRIADDWYRYVEFVGSFATSMGVR